MISLEKNVITSKTNKKYSKYKSLSDKKFRQKYGLYKVESLKMIEEAIKSEVDIEDIIVSEESKYLTLFENPFVIAEELFSELTDMVNSDGLIGIIKIPEFGEDLFSEKLLCLDEIKDPGNMGTIIRSAEAFGFTEILLMPGCVDIYNPKTLRASMGSIYRINIKQTNKDEVLKLKENSYKIISSSLDKSQDIKDININYKYILVIGSESHGISSFFQELSDIFIKIPMQGEVESLNAGVASSILMYELSEL